MNIGDIVALVKVADEVATKVPAIVTKVYHNVHGEVVADLHELESTIRGVVSKEENSSGSLPTDAGSVHITTDLTSAPEVPAPAASAAAPAAPSAQLSEEEAAFSKLSPEDQAAFLEWQKNQGQTEQGSGAPS